MMNFKCDVWWSISCARGWLIYLVIYLLLVSVCIKFSRGLWKWKTNIGWECGAITGLLGRVENLYLIKHKLHSHWKQWKAFTNVIWNNWCKQCMIFFLSIATVMTDGFSLRLRLKHSLSQHLINLCVTMSYYFQMEYIQISRVSLIWMLIIKTTKKTRLP